VLVGALPNRNDFPVGPAKSRLPSLFQRRRQLLRFLLCQALKPLRKSRLIHWFGWLLRFVPLPVVARSAWWLLVQWRPLSRKVTRSGRQYSRQWLRSVLIWQPVPYLVLICGSCPREVLFFSIHCLIFLFIGIICSHPGVFRTFHSVSTLVVCVSYREKML
jgi:hypothetical protein